VPTAVRPVFLPILLAAALGSCAHNGPAASVTVAGEAAPSGELPRYCTHEECDIVVSHNSETEDCECDARRLDESFGARLELVFSVPPGGGAAQVAVGRAISVPEALQRCVLGHAATWKFPPSGGDGARFRAGIIFAPDDHGACARPSNAPSHQARVDKERARLALLAQRGEVEACIKQGGGVSPLIESRAVVTLLLNREGRVIQAQVDDSTLPDQKIEQCIVEKAFGWRLPKPNPPGVITLSYPYAFPPTN
jgi:hypothetical protein